MNLDVGQLIALFWIARDIRAFNMSQSEAMARWEDLAGQPVPSRRGRDWQADVARSHAWHAARADASMRPDA